MNENWEYVPFESLFNWGEKSLLTSGEGKSTGKYKMFICSDSEIKHYDEFLLNTEALVFGTGGKASCHYVNEPFAYSTDCAVALPKSSEYSCKFYYYLLRQNRLQKLQSTFSGSGLQHTSKKKIEKILLPILAKEEQERIVAKIEELFSQLDSGVQALEKLKKQLTMYRRTILSNGFSGCTEHKKIEQVCKCVTDGDHMPPPKEPQGVPFIMISNIKNHKINWENTNYVGEEYFNRIGEKRTPAQGDVLYTVTGSYGIPVLVDFERKFCFQRHIALLRPNEKILQKYLYYVLQSPMVYRQATDMATGTAQKTVALSVIRKIIIPYCDLAQQEKIVSRLEAELSECSNIQQSVVTALRQTEAMRQSILKNAFEE